MYTSMIQTRQIDEFLRSARLSVAYIEALPPRGKFLHSNCVQFGSEKQSIVVQARLVEDLAGHDSFSLAIEDKELTPNRPEGAGEHKVQVPTDLLAVLRNAGLQDLIDGPRSLKHYGKKDTEHGGYRLEALELISKNYPKQRILLAESTDIYTDVAVVLPSTEYDETLTSLSRIDDLAGED